MEKGRKVYCISTTPSLLHAQSTGELESPQCLLNGQTTDVLYVKGGRVSLQTYGFCIGI